MSISKETPHSVHVSLHTFNQLFQHVINELVKLRSWPIRVFKSTCIDWYVFKHHVHGYHKWKVLHFQRKNLNSIYMTKL